MEGLQTVVASVSNDWFSALLRSQSPRKEPEDKSQSQQMLS